MGVRCHGVTASHAAVAVVTSFWVNCISLKKWRIMSKVSIRNPDLSFSHFLMNRYDDADVQYERESAELSELRLTTEFSSQKERE